MTSITSTSLCLLVSCATSVYSAAFLGCGAFYLLFMLASGFVLPAGKEGGKEGGGEGQIGVRRQADSRNNTDKLYQSINALS